MTVAYECDSMYMCVNFEDEIFLRRIECKTRQNSNFRNSTGGKFGNFLNLG